MRRTGRSQLKLRRKAGGATHAFHHTRQQQPNFMKDWHTKKFRKLTCESEQGYHATEVMEKRVLDMQPKVMSQACHVFIPRPIVDNIQPEGGCQRMSCVMLLFLVVLLLITYCPEKEGRGWVSLSWSWWGYGVSLWVTWCTSQEVQLGRKISRLHLEASKAASVQSAALLHQCWAMDTVRFEIDWVRRHYRSRLKKEEKEQIY